MSDTSYLVTAVAAAAVVTCALRALPFTALAHLRASTAVDYLSARMPLGVMVILLAYSLRSLPLADPLRALPDILAWPPPWACTCGGATPCSASSAAPPSTSPWPPSSPLPDGGDPNSIGDTR